MKHDYCIINKSCSKYNAIVTGLSAVNSLTDFFDDIAKDLVTENISGKILLDYYKYNRSEKRRFFEIDFINNSFPLKSLKMIDTSIILNDVYSCYKQEPALSSFIF
jgi:hypothetical protein